MVAEEEVVQEGGLRGAQLSRQKEGLGFTSRRLATCPQKSTVVLPETVQTFS